MEMQFKEVGEKMRFQPSEKAWQKLEQRLQQEKLSGTKRLVLKPWIGAVAASLLLALSVLWWRRPSGNAVESLVHSRPPASIEELEATGSCEPYCLMIQHRNELPADYRYPKVRAVQ